MTKFLQSKDREEESKALQSQVDSLQQDLGNLQQRLTEKDDKIAAIKRYGVEESEALQSQVDSLQQDLENLHQRLTEKDDKIAAIKRHREEESKALQSQVDSLQQDLGNLQQRLTEKNDETAAIIIESQCNQDRIETLELEKQELTTKMESLEAKCKVEFFRDTYSWEVDQLRGDLMDKIAEIDRRNDLEKENRWFATSASSQLGKLQLIHTLTSTKKTFFKQFVKCMHKF